MPTAVATQLRHVGTNVYDPLGLESLTSYKTKGVQFVVHALDCLIEEIHDVVLELFP